ncbi:MAG: hypothetical protein ICV74_08855, partial [Thermoleophilia bacterium]|nr:hypothetical protein [Thermoleophilia bacterium]
MRRALVLAALALALPEAALADALTLRADPASAQFGSRVRFTGELAPAREGVPVALYAGAKTAWALVAETTTRGDGRYAFSLTARRPRSFRAVAQLDAGTQTVSPSLAIRIR